MVTDFTRIFKALPRQFYETDTITVARSLLGMEVVHNSAQGSTSGIITETETYTGLNDPASHSYKINSKRVSVQYRQSGLAYIFLIYGIYFCFNITTGKAGSPEAVLIRAIRPISGIELMKVRRKTDNIARLANGPGKLSQAMGINMSHYGIDLTGSELFVAIPQNTLSFEIEACKRVNIEYAGYAKDFPYRFLLREKA